MLSEEALIVLVAFGACGLLLLGVAELLWPTKPRQPPGRPFTIEPPVEAPAPPALEAAYPVDATPPLTEPSEVTPAPTVAARAPRVHRTSALARHGLEPGHSPYVRRSGSCGESSEPEPAAAPGERAAEMPEAPREISVVERCFELHQARRDAEAVALGMAALESAGETVPAAAHATAALWSVMARARQGLGQDAEARKALESAIAAAPVADRPTYQAQLAALADGVARRFLTEADKHPRPESEERLAAIGCAMTWAECAAEALPSDPALASLAAAAQAMVWPAYERTVVALVQRQDFRAARRLLREALADSRFPADRLERFYELYSVTFSGEMGQLTAQAIRSMQEGREAEAVSALERVESLLETLSDEALSPERREEIGRRLSWGYHKLGERRVAAGKHEAALDPLYHALDYETDADRRLEMTALLVRGLEGVTDTRALVIRAHVKAGERETAVAECDALWALLRSATDRGVTLADLAASFTKVQGLFETLGPQ